MRKLLQRKIAHHFVHVDIQRLRVFGHVLHDQSAGGILQQRDALIEAAAHLMGQVAGGTPQLHGERRVADESHQLRRILHLVRNRNFDGACENPGNLGLYFAVAETLRQNRSQSVVHRFGHGEANCAHASIVSSTQPARVSSCVSPCAGLNSQAVSSHRFASLMARLAISPVSAFTLLSDPAPFACCNASDFRQFDVDRPLFHGLPHISHGVESAGGERLHHGLDLFGLGQRARILTHQLVAYGFRHVGKLVPCHLALNRSEAIDKPLADRILIHTVSCLCSTRLLSPLPSIVWEAWPICRKHSEFTPKAHVTGRLKAFCHVSDDVGVRSDGGSMFALGDISPDRLWPCSACWCLLRPARTWCRSRDRPRTCSGKVEGKQVIDVSGVKTHKDSGKLLLVTVNASGVPGYPVTNAQALLAWANPKATVIPQEAVFPVGQSAKDYAKESNKEMSSSQSAAATAAKRFLKAHGYDVSGMKVSMHVDDIGGPSAGMMYTLGLIDKVTGEQLSGGKTIAGTGTMNAKAQGWRDRRHPVEDDRREA